MAILGATQIDVSTRSTSFVRNYTARYHVTTDAPTVDLKSIVEYSSIPEYGTEFPGDPISVVQEKTAAQVNGTRTKFLVTVIYGPYDRAGHNSSADEFSNPLDAPAEYTWGFSSRQEPVTHDVNNKAILNTAGDPFIPAPEKTVYDLQLTIVQNVEDYRPLQSWNRVGTVNNRQMTIAGLLVPAKAALMKERTATSQIFTEDDDNIRIEYWEVTTVLIFREVDQQWLDEEGEIIGPFNSWFKRVLNAGMEAKVEQNGVLVGPVPIRGEDGEQTKEPKLLKLDGTRELDPEQANWVAAEVYKATDFGVLQL